MHLQWTLPLRFKCKLDNILILRLSKCPEKKNQTTSALKIETSLYLITSKVVKIQWGLLNNISKDWYIISTGLFDSNSVTVHIALNVVLKCHYFSQMVDFFENTVIRFHLRNLIDFTVLAVIFINLSSGTFHQWSMDLCQESSIYFTTHNLNTSKQIAPLVSVV